MAQAQDSGAFKLMHVWSCPRSLSTSLMYSFAQRDDTEVVDEPLYANYLRVSGAQRPYREQLLATMVREVHEILAPRSARSGHHSRLRQGRTYYQFQLLPRVALLSIELGAYRSPTARKCMKSSLEAHARKNKYCKHMAKQRTPDIPNDIMDGMHVLLIRDPAESLPSFDEVIPVSFRELELGQLLNIFIELRELGRQPPVVDATLLQRNPEGILRSLCSALKIPFRISMLRWEAGPKAEDGLWAPWWYSSVHKSTGFAPRKHPIKPFPSKLYGLLEECQPFYNMLIQHALQPPNAILPPALPVPANERLLVWVDDHLVPREAAKVSVFDSVVQGGDGVWEGLRVYKGLFDSAKAMAFVNVPTFTEVKQAIFTTLVANGMSDCAHIRLTLTRGKKVTSGMSPAFNKYGCTLIVLAEWKPPVYDNTAGIRLVTASTHRNSPNCLDSKIHHNNLINNILAKVEGNLGGADDAILLDCDGFVSETNATNIFMVKNGTVFTPHSDYCLPGVTRATVIELVRREKLLFTERRLSLSEFHTADEVWTTGTMGEISPVIKIDGRIIGDEGVGPITGQLQVCYSALTLSSGEPIPGLSA